MKGQLISGTESTTVAKQHTKPCGDCPWARTSLAGWTGSVTPEEWIETAHRDDVVSCHAHKGKDGRLIQCVGIAVYRKNVVKSVRPDAYRRLGAEPIAVACDRKNVFATPGEFLSHHAHGPQSAESVPSSTSDASVPRARKTKDDRRDINDAIDEAIDSKKMSANEALEWLEELACDVEARIGGLKSDIARSE